MEKDFEQSARNLRREYLRKWRSEHPERVREHNKRYWIRRAEREALENVEAKNDQS